MPDKPQLSISDLTFFETCPYAFSLRRTLNAWSEPGPALRLGKQLHKYMEWWRKGSTEPPPPLTEPGLARLIEAAALTPAAIPFTNVHTELLLQLEFPTFILCGTPDDISTNEEGYWSLQWKSVAAALAPGAQARHVAFSPHEITYAFLVEQLLDISLLGTSVGIFRKLPEYRIVNGEPVFSLLPVRRSSTESAALFAAHIRPRFERMAESIRTGEFVRRYEACLGAYRNSPCAAYSHCHYGLELEQLGLPAVLESRYPEFNGTSATATEHVPGAAAPTTRSSSEE